jgi:hypothetical protein
LLKIPTNVDFDIVWQTYPSLKGVSNIYLFFSAYDSYGINQISTSQAISEKAQTINNVGLSGGGTQEALNLKWWCHGKISRFHAYPVLP